MNNPTQPLPESRNPKSGRPAFLAYFATILAIGVSWWFVAPLIGMGTIGILFFFVIGSTLSLTIVGSWSSEAGPARTFGLFLASFVIVCILLIGETLSINSYLMKNPPARPMFNNHFGEHERSLLPFWWGPRPIVDGAGNWCWADFDDNVLAIVITGDSTRGRYSPIRCGMNETRFKAGADSGEAYVTVPRSTNRLVVIPPNATLADFPLPLGAAAGFEEEFVSAGAQDALESARAKIADGYRSRFDEFVGAFLRRSP